MRTDYGKAGPFPAPVSPPATFIFLSQSLPPPSTHFINSFYFSPLSTYSPTPFSPRLRAFTFYPRPLTRTCTFVPLMPRIIPNQRRFKGTVGHPDI